MHSRIMLGAVAMAGLILLAACNRETAYNSSPANDAVGTIAGEITTSTKAFIDEATLTDMYEVQAGQLATMRAHRAGIKDFGQHMVDDHTKSANELKTILMMSALDFMPPMELDSRHEDLLTDLKDAEDEDFEGRYIAQQITAHNEALMLMRTYAKGGDIPDIKAFAAKAQPMVEMHLDMINDIDRAHRARDAQARNNGNTKTR